VSNLVWHLIEPILTHLSAVSQVLLGILTAVLGLILLLRGRKLYWLLVGVVGFFAGIYLGLRFVTAGGWLHWALVLGAGIVAVILAKLAQRLMVILAAVLVFASVGYTLLPYAWPAVTRYLAAALLGLAGMFLALKLFDWALIIGSSVAGAWMLYGAMPMLARVDGTTLTLFGRSLPLVLAGLALLGTLFQWMTYKLGG